MKRYFSHFTFIFPDQFLKNHIIEQNKEGYITSIYPFVEEVSNTEFMSGLIVFLPSDLMNTIRESDMVNLHPEIEDFIISSNYLVRSFTI